jgi:crooked neck
MERNKQPSEFQISAEQILLEAYERKDEPLNRTNVKITDLEELHESQRRTRKEYEDALRRNRLDFGQWMRYAQYEIDQNDMRRARSIFERALEINSHHVPLWIRYIDSELKTRNINHARNLFDRVTTILPRIDKFWFRYVQTEETLQDISGTREVFKRWMAWEPDTPAWDAYINFEKRYDELENVRKIFNQYVVIHPFSETWLKWAKFEQDYGDSSTVREVFTAAVDTLQSERLIVSFAQWEASQREWERTRAIFKFGLAKSPNSKLIQEQLTQFEKQYGDKDGIEISIIHKRRQKYEAELEQDSTDYDTWWAYISLLDDQPLQVKRDTFEKAVSNPPKSSEKVHWKRYIFLWIRYAIFEELAGEVERARDVYDRATKITPAKSFTFSKIWILYSQFEIRNGDLTRARKLLGFSIGAYPKAKTFKFYISLEIQLKEFDRVRKIYEKFVDTFPGRSDVWIEFAELESGLNEVDRARAIFELALDVMTKDQCKIWDKYVEFESDQNEYENARNLYERQLQNDKNSTTVWIKSALFELTVPTSVQIEAYNKKVEDTGDYDMDFEFEISEEAKTKSREVFERALTHFKDPSLKESRIVIFEAFKEFEQVHGDAESQEKLGKRLPSVVKKIKTLEDGSIEEYYDYVFPDDKKVSNKFLEMAKKWSKKK